MTSMTGRRALAAALALGALGGACALNPATGKREFSLVSESQEIAIGREADGDVVAEMGLYDDPALQTYVEQLGRRVAAASERPGLPWTFRVVDDPVVNAFALPGGYIYITRGILAHFDNETELVSVLGHEVGHVTARHGASQMSKAQLAQIGLGVGYAVAPERMGALGDVLQTGLGLVFLKYGRDDERQADDLGLRYLLRLGYDPHPMADVFDMLGRVSEAAGGGGTPGWLSTHPRPENRRERILAEIPPSSAAGAGGTGAAFRERVEGIVFGDDPRQGYFKDNLFFHPALQFRFEFPAGWQLQNQRQAVVGVGPRQEAIVTVTLVGASSAEEAYRAFFSGNGIERGGSPMNPIHGLPTHGEGFAATTDAGRLRGRVGFVDYGGAVFRLLGYGTEAGWGEVEPAVRASLASFDRLTEPRYLDVKPARLHFVVPPRDMTLDELAERYDASVPVAALALLNRLDQGQGVRAGATCKIVTGGRIP